MVHFPPKYDERDDFDFDVVNFPFLDGDVPRRTYGVYISQLTRFARASSNLSAFNCYNKIRPLLPNFLGRAIVILNFVSVFEILSQTQCPGKKNITSV